MGYLGIRVMAYRRIRGIWGLEEFDLRDLSIMSWGIRGLKDLGYLGIVCLGDGGIERLGKCSHYDFFFLSDFSHLDFFFNNNQQ